MLFLFYRFSQVLSSPISLSLSIAQAAALGGSIPAAANDAAVFAGLLSGFLTPVALGALRGGAGATPALCSSEATGFDGCAPCESQWRMRSSLRPTCLVPSLAVKVKFADERGEKEGRGVKVERTRRLSAASPLSRRTPNSILLLFRSNYLLSKPTWNGVVVPDDLDVLAVARRPRVGDEDAVEREVLF